MNTHKAVNRTNKIGNNNTLLKKGLVPGIVYGKGTESVKIAIENKVLNKLIHEGGFYTKIINIDIDGKIEKVLPKELQFHPVSDKLIHFDLQRIQENTKVTVEVPVQFLGQENCPGLKKGGVLNIVRRTIELICNANKIPEKLEFNLEDYDIGDAIKISQIQLQEDVKLTITDRDFVVATLVPPTIEVETKPEEEETVEGEGEGEEAVAETEGEEKTEDKKEDITSAKETKEQKEEDKK